MNAMPDSFVVNSCQYTPVYLIQDSGASQVQSFFIAQSNVEEPLQVTDNLKAFYESSGNIENTFVNVNGRVGSPKPRILKKPDTGAVGNNLKLASFLQPKNDSLKQQYLMNSMVLKPTTATNPSSTITSTTYATANNTRLNIDSKIVKLKDVALKARYNRIERVPQPKSTKPKDVTPATIPVSPNVTVSVPTVPICVSTVQMPLNIPSVPTPVLTAPVNTMPTPNTSLPSKHTSVQLLKLGETYHSLNQLSDEQMKMVTQALKIFSNPEKNDPEPTYDPVTNTKFIYKVVSPKELTVVGNNKTIVPLKSYTESCEKKKIEKILSKELKKEAVRENLRKKYLAKDVKKEVPEFLVPKESIFKFESKKEFIAKQQNLMKGELKKARQDPSEKEGLLKTEPIKESIFKGEQKKEGILKGESKKEGLHKAEPRKEGIVEPKKEGVYKVDSKKDGVSKVENKKNILKNESSKKEASLKKARDKFVKQMEKEMLEEKESKETEKVTRSGRKVKLPKPILPLDTPHKPKKKNVIIPCFQCAEEFNSLYRLQKHYESHPTHIPSKIHSNLFHCLVAIVNGGSEEDRTNIFIQQLEQLVVKLRSLLPCLLSTSETGKTSNVSEDVGNLLGVFPGRYSIDIDALECVKTTEGLCRHKRAPTPTYDHKEDHSQTWTTIEEDFSTPEAETDDCARINSVEKWPTVNKRVWKQKQKKNAKRIRLASENDALIELGIDDFVMLANPPVCLEESAINTPKDTEIKADIKECDGFSEPNSMSLPDSESLNLPQNPEQTEFRHLDPTSLLETDSQSANLEQIASAIAILEKENNPTNHLQFHSAHFDIRSSPIKPTSTVFRKFQISPELLAKCETQSIRSIETVDKDRETLQSDERNSLKEIGEHLSDDPDDLNEIPGNLNEISQNFNRMPHNLDAIQDNLNAIPENLDGITSNLSKIARSLNEIPPISNGITNNLKESLPECTDATHCPISNEHNNEDSTDAITTDETLRQIFREEDLSKESFTLDRELKDWILNRSSNEEKSEDGFDKSNTLIEPSLIHINNHEIKTVCDVIEQKGLPSDNHDDSSVLNFLDTLGNACLSYPGTEIRTNGDFQLDLFSFHST